MDFMQILNSINFSNIGWEIVTPLIFSFCDVLSGYIQAIINKDLDSQKMREGLLRKILLIMVVILSVIVEFTMNIPLVAKVISVYIILMELTSILENLTKAGVNFGKLAELLKITNKEDK